MTPDEHRRLQEVERRLAISEEQRRQANETMARIEGKLDTLLMAAAMGKGAFWFATRIGGFSVVLLTGFYWAADHFHWWQK